MPSSTPANQLASATRDNDAYAWTGHYNVDRNYTANGLNQYSAAGSASFTYDMNGNLTSDGTTSYTYDIENRLVSASGATTAALRYDPMGRLYETGAAVGPTRLLYDGDALIAEYTTAGTLVRRYVHGPRVDEPLAWYDSASVGNASRRRLRADRQGSVVAITDDTGTAIALNTYDEYGIPSANNLGRFQYSGQAWIPELGMYHYKAHIYSPTLGRFFQTDPIGYENQLNLYAYVGNDLVNGSDPTGKRLELRTHGISGSNVRHAKLVIIPKNQDAYKNNPKFDSFPRNENGEIYFTIGGGSDKSQGLDLKTLVGSMNRPTDVNLSNDIDVVTIVIDNRNEDSVITGLARSIIAFTGDKLDYAPVPGILDSDGYNSNSFVTGLLKANNLDSEDTRAVTDNLYGGDKPVPENCFGKGDPNACK